MVGFLIFNLIYAALALLGAYLALLLDNDLPFWPIFLSLYGAGIVWGLMQGFIASIRNRREQGPNA